MNVEEQGYEHPLIYITLPFGCPSRIYLIKTLLEKNSMEKNSSKGKRVQQLFVSAIPQFFILRFHFHAPSVRIKKS